MKRMLWIFLLIAAGHFAHGNGYQVMLQSNRVTAMGNCGTGVVAGAASLFFNPGALGFMNQSELMIGSNRVYGRTNFVAQDDFAQYEARPQTQSGHLYFVWADSASKFRAGLGVVAPFGSTVEYEDAWVGRYALTKLSLLALNIQPTVAYKLSDKLSVGAGLNILVGSVNLQRDISLNGSDGSVGTLELDGKAKTDIGFNVGLFYMPSTKWSVGLNYRSRMDAVVEGGKSTFTTPASTQYLFPANNNFGAALPLPSTTSIGIGFYPNAKWTFAADVNYVGWSAYETLTINFDQKIPALGNSDALVSQRNYENTFIFHFGTEYMASEKLALRAGVYYDQTPVQDGYMTPETPDSNAMGYTFGFGLKPSSKISIDGSFLYVNKAQRENRIPTGVATGGLNGTYKVSAIIPGLGINIKF